MKSANTMRLRLSIFLLSVVLILSGFWLWWIDGVRPVDPADSRPVLFAVRRGEGVRLIAAKLAQANLIRSPTAFFLLVKILGIERSLQAGEFRINRTMDARAVAQELTHGVYDVWVTTLEGWRLEEIANRLAKDMDIPEAEFLKVAREGYMFPDTYQIPRDASASAIAAIFLETFNLKVTQAMREDAKKIGLRFDEVVTLASIVEREGKTDEDRAVIAGILLKRLAASWPLQADATLQYAAGWQPAEKTWWKKSLTEADKKIKSSYNTYLNPGLPPAPIANPGLAAIKAVIYPADTDYWYYLHDEAGRVHFAKTFEEHNANIAKYLQ